MSMDESTQQNAALVEETTSAAQSMKGQARDLMEQVETFKFAQSENAQTGSKVVKRDLPRLVPKSASKGAGDHRTAGKAPVGSMKSQGKAGAALAVGNGRDRRVANDEFDEF